ncbi:MAG: thioredoxin fold domain-containing protein [Deltaproteobacteria bacterium]|nr:thioredoxin fold domain-containing protein [Deltaproteobacteria bacterium]
MNRKLLGVFIMLLICASVAWAQAEMPEEAKKHLVKGIEAMEMAQSPDDFEQAVREFEDAARLAPDSPDVHYYLGKTLSLVKGQAGRAIKELERYLELAPGAPDAQKVRGEMAGLEELKNARRKSGSLGFLPVALPDGVYVKYVYPGARLIDHRLKRGVKGIGTAGMSLKDFLNHMDGEPGSSLELDIIKAGEQQHIKKKRNARKLMKGFRELGEEYFDDIISESTKPIVVVFWSPWCKPCETLSRMMVRVSVSYKRLNEVVLLSASVDEHPDLVDRYKIESLPTTLFFKQGHVADRLEGGTNQEFSTKLSGFVKNYEAY